MAKRSAAQRGRPKRSSGRQRKQLVVDVRLLEAAMKVTGHLGLPSTVSALDAILPASCSSSCRSAGAVAGHLNCNCLLTG